MKKILSVILAILIFAAIFMFTLYPVINTTDPHLRFLGVLILLIEIVGLYLVAIDLWENFDI